jgi:DNA-binding NtrC family response regulator
MCSDANKGVDVQASGPYPESARPTVGNQMKTIVMYSPDLDLCMSLTLYFQDKYVVVTTTDGTTLPSLVETYHPSLVIADALPTTWILKLFDEWKEKHPDMRVMLFRVWRYEDRKREAAIHKSIDFVLYKPIDIDFVAHIVDGLFEEGKKTASTSAPLLAESETERRRDDVKNDD